MTERLLTAEELAAVNLHPRIWFKQVWDADVRPPGIREWTEEQTNIFSDMLGTAHPAVIAQAMGRPFREVWHFEHDIIENYGMEMLDE